MNVTLDPRTATATGDTKTENISKDQTSAFGAMVARNEPAMQMAQRGRPIEVYVMDDFGTNRYAPGVGHGEVVAGIIAGKTGINPRVVDLNTGNDSPSAQMAVLARSIRQIIGQDGRPLDNVYINISYAVDSRAVAASPRVWAVLKAAIEEATARGATITIGAGNDYFNEFTTFKGVIPVGGPRGTYVDNPLIRARGNPVANLRPVGNRLDVTDDGRGDIPLPGGPGSLQRTRVNGTSFASPDVLSNIINSRR